MLEELIQQRTNLVIQRAHAKDTVEQLERALGQVNAVIQTLEAIAKADAEAHAERVIAEAKAEVERLAAVDATDPVLTAVPIVPPTPTD